MNNTPTILGGVTQSISSGLSSIQNQASGLSSIASSYTDLANSYIGTVDSVLSAVGLGGVLSGTVGAVLSNGFNVSCFGASLTPQKAQDRVKKYYEPYINYLVSNHQNATTIEQKIQTFNAYIKAMYVIEYYYRVIKVTQADWSSCAKKAINSIYKPFFGANKQNAESTLSQILAQGATKENKSLSPVQYVIPMATFSGTKDYTAGEKNTKWSIEYPQLKTWTVTQSPPASIETPTQEHTQIFGPHALDEDDSDVNNSNNKPEEKGGISALQFGITLLGLGFLK